jgi:hypothetical protein
MTMRVVDREVFIGDEGRPIFYAGVFRQQPYYVPFEDVPALDRRRFWWTISGFVVFGCSWIGAAAGAWSVWWCTLGVLATFVSPIVVANWVSERFDPVSDPTIATDVRRTAVLRGPTVGAMLMTVALSGAQLSLSWLDHRYNRRFSFIVFGSYFVVSLVGLLTVKRGRDEFGDGYEPPSTGITR